jgi:hypothetical protein
VWVMGNVCGCEGYPILSRHLLLEVVYNRSWEEGFPSIHISVCAPDLENTGPVGNGDRATRGKSMRIIDRRLVIFNLPTAGAIQVKEK